MRGVRAIGATMTEIRELWGWPVELLAIAAVLFAIYAVFKAPEWFENWRWNREDARRRRESERWRKRS